MERKIQAITNEYLEEALDLVEQVFTEYENEKEGKMVRRLVEEIRSKKYYLPELELIALDEQQRVIGYVMFSRFHLEGKYEDSLLLLSPAAVRTDLQRQHISKDIIEFGFQRAKELGYKAVLVEGNPRNYNARGFRTSSDYGIYPGETVRYPRKHKECLMVKELQLGALEEIKGIVEYDCYETLQEE